MVCEGVDHDLDRESALAPRATLVAHQKVPGGSPSPSGFGGFHVLDSARRLPAPRVSFGPTSQAFGPKRYSILGWRRNRNAAAIG